MLLLGPAQAYAGTSTGSLVYAPLRNGAAGIQDIPVLSGPVLMVLSALLGLVAFRILRRRLSGTLSAALSALGTAALLAIAAGTSGVRNAEADVIPIPLPNPSGGSVVIFPEPGIHFYENTSGVQLKILSVTPPLPCVIISEGTTCTPNLVLALADQCSVSVGCGQ